MGKPGEVILRSLLKDITKIVERAFSVSELHMEGVNRRYI